MPRPRPCLLLTAAALVTALVAGGCSSGSARSAARSSTPSTTAPTTPATTTTLAPTTTTTAAPTQPVWAPCSTGFECATLTPPLDWDHPDGATARLAVVRLKASGPAAQRIGSLLVNPGGPGASGVELARAARNFIPAAVLARFDVVGFDPRGTGSSEPIVCESGPDLDQYFATDPTPDNAAERQALIDANRRFAEDCARRGGALLGHVDTRTAARDMDYLRAALGETTVSYLGYSYGTMLGAMYADLFPNRVRAFVLDGAIDPAIGVEQTNRDQAVGFEQAFKAFLADCAASVTCPLRADGDPRTVFDQLNARVDAQSMAVGPRALGPGELFYAVVSALYRKSDWAPLASALHAAVSAGDAGPLLRMSDAYVQRHADGSYGPLLSANAAVNCIDRSWSTNVADYDADAKSFEAQSPEFGAALAYGGLACAFWKAPAVDRERPLHAAGAPPILVVGTTNDPATPYKWAQALASELRSGVLVTHPGEGHTSLASPTPCLTAAVIAFLISQTVPANRANC